MRGHELYARCTERIFDALVDSLAKALSVPPRAIAGALHGAGSAPIAQRSGSGRWIS